MNNGMVGKVISIKVEVKDQEPSNWRLAHRRIADTRQYIWRVGCYELTLRETQ